MQLKVMHVTLLCILATPVASWEHSFFGGGAKVRIFRQGDNFSDKNVTVSGFDFYDSIRQRIENKRREKFDRLIFGFFRQKGENDEFSDNIFSGGLGPLWPPRPRRY